MARLNLKSISRPKPETENRDGFLRLDRNERTSLISDLEFKNLINTLNPFDLTPYSILEPFYSNVVELLKIKREQILLTHGSEQAIKLIFDTFIDKNSSVINYTPNFQMYSVYIQMFGAKEVQKFYNDNLELDAKNLIQSIDSSIKLIVISNPGHNGKLIPKDDLLKIIKIAEKNDCLVIVDEAYADFSDFSIVDEISNFKNLLVIKTMSKAFGLASLRIGFLISNEMIINEVYKIKPVHEISGLSAKIGSYFIENIQIRNAYISNIHTSIDYLKKEFIKLKINFHETHANFMYFKLDEKYNPDNIINDFKLKKILIKKGSNTKPFKDFLRITIGEIDQMRMFIKALRKIIS
jgi:histidinol-phosphate aminotransferase